MIKELLYQTVIKSLLKERAIWVSCNCKITALASAKQVDTHPKRLAFVIAIKGDSTKCLGLNTDVYHSSPIYI